MFELLVVLMLGLPAAAGAPGGAQPGGAQPGAAAPQAGKKAPPKVVYRNPSEAYQAGAYDQALQGFVDMQVDRPDDPAIMLNIGSAHYKLKDYAEARKAFEQAAMAGTPPQRTKALYNLGDTAYRQGKLDEAIAYYQATLESNPNHERAKKNIEFVRDEIRRRHEQAKKQQQEQQQQEQQQQQQQNGQNPNQPEPGDGQKQPGDPQQQKDQQQQQPQEGDGKRDSDHDGLTDAQERQGPNKTDPHNPDTDGDGKRDGDEDTNKNGRQDPGESDPTQADAAAKPDEKQGGEPQEQQGEAHPGSMSKQEAERYLQSVGENRPKNRGNTSGSPSRVRNGKDW